MRQNIQKIYRGLPFIRKEIESWISLRTPLFISTPRIYYVFYGTRCNARCVTCTQDHKAKEPELTPDVMRKILQESKALSGKGFNISFAGGEPLLFKPIFDMLKLAHELNVDVGFTTNGYLLTADNVKRIISYDPFSMGVSIESVDPKINEMIRPYKNGTQLTLDGIERLLEEKIRRRSRIGIVIKPTITELNYAAIPDLIRYFGKKEGLIINLQPYRPWTADQKINDPYNLSIKDLNLFRKVIEEIIYLKKDGYAVNASDETLTDFIEHFDDMKKGGNGVKKQQRICSIGTTNVFIGPDGNIKSCPFFAPIGNIYENSIEEIWRGSKAQSSRKRIKKCRINCTLSCTRPISVFTKFKSYMKLG